VNRNEGTRPKMTTKPRDCETAMIAFVVALRIESLSVE
jgi:hypothetical protein